MIDKKSNIYLITGLILGLVILFYLSSYKFSSEDVRLSEGDDSKFPEFGSLSCPANYQKCGGFCCSPNEVCKKYPPIFGKKYCNYNPNEDPKGDGNPCPPEKPKFCEGGNRNECCDQEDICGVVTGNLGAESAVCVGPGGDEPNCEDKEGYTKCGDYCCTPDEECIEILGASVCQDKPSSCKEKGLEPCPGLGDKSNYNLCCPPGKCSHHLNGVPFCKYF